MKYLDNDLYEKVCSPEGDRYKPEWKQQYDAYIRELLENANRLPIKFLSEYTKSYFHNFTLVKCSLDRVKVKTQYTYQLTIELLQTLLQQAKHILVFQNVTGLEINTENQSVSSYALLHFEMLAVNKDRMSFEGLFAPNGMVKFQFGRLQYQKEAIEKR